ncbi:GntR family transcriptional regulator [Streptomyces sp. NPDC002078]
MVTCGYRVQGAAGHGQLSEEILRARIRRGGWAPGRAIASETQLVQQYGLARSTVRRAIAVLVESGEVFTVPQRGTYVAEKPSSEAI